MTWDISLAKCWVYSAWSLLRDGNQILGHGYIYQETTRRLKQLRSHHE